MIELTEEQKRMDRKSPHELQARLHSLYNGRTLIRGVGPQMVGLERYRVIATWEQLYTLLEAADLLGELEAELELKERQLQSVLQGARHIHELETRIVAITKWLEANQPDVFQRGLWDSISTAPDANVANPLSTANTEAKP